MKPTKDHNPFKRAVAVVFVAALFVACGAKDQASAEDQHDHGPEVGEEEVLFNKRQMSMIGIELGHFQNIALTNTVRSAGKLVLPPQKKASLGPVMEGRVKHIMVLEGDKVSKSEVLAYLEHPTYIELQQQYLKVKSQLDFLEKDYLRKRTLYESNVESASALQDVQADLHSAQAELKGLGAKLEMLGLNVEKVEQGEIFSTVPLRSPINGHIRSIAVNLGTYVMPNEEIFEIVDNEHIHIDLHVYEKDMAKIKNGQKVIFSLASNPDLLFEASIFALGKAFEQETKAMVVHAEIENNTGGLLPGMYVDARVVIKEEEVRALPNDAIVSDGGLNYIFMLRPQAEKHAHNKEFLFRKIAVGTGKSDLGYTEVILAFDPTADMEIVTKGAFYLLAQMKKGEGGHGHSH